MATPRPFPTDPVATGWAIAYRNEAYIADLVAPRVPVGAPSFRYTMYSALDAMRIVDTLVGRASAPRRVEFGGKEMTGSVEDHGLDAPVPQADVNAAAANRAAGYGGFDPERRAVEGVAECVALAREARVAGLLFNPATYGAGYKALLSGTAQFSDPTSDIVGQIEAAINGTFIIRPNTLTMGKQVWDKIKTHPKLVAHILGAASTRGYVTLEELKAAFNLRDIRIGESLGVAALPGQANATPQPLWGKHMALTYVAPMAAMGMPTFIITAQWRERVSGWIADPDIGLEGGRRYRVGEHVKEAIVAAESGFLIQNAVA